MKQDLENIKPVLPIGPPEGSYMEGNILHMPNNKVIKSIDYNIVGDCSHLNMKFTIPAKGLTEEEINSIIKKLVCRTR